MLPSQCPEFKVYPAVDNFVTYHLAMQFDDVRCLMKLPLPEVGLGAGCNFAAAATLCNLISGISVVLYTPKDPSSGSGKKFKGLLEKFYPWEPGEKKAEKSKVIYDLVRNPLAHSLGVLKKGSLPISIMKDALTEAQLEEVENSSVRPTWVPLAVTGDSTRYVLSVVGLYWGVFHLVRQLAKNARQMQQAEERIAKRFEL
jgi:hypothetical protein